MLLGFQPVFWGQKFIPEHPTDFGHLWSSQVAPLNLSRMDILTSLERRKIFFCVHQYHELFLGAGGVGRRHIKNTLIARNPSRYTYPRPRKYCIAVLKNKTSVEFLFFATF